MKRDYLVSVAHVIAETESGELAHAKAESCVIAWFGGTKGKIGWANRKPRWRLDVSLNAYGGNSR